MLSIIKNYLSYNPNKNMEWGLGFTMAFVFAYNSAQKEYLPLLLLWYWAYSGNRIIIVASVLSYIYYTYILYCEDVHLAFLLFLGMIFFMRDMYFLFKYQVSAISKDSRQRLMTFVLLAIFLGIVYYFKS